jgi:hypothetical protein
MIIVAAYPGCLGQHSHQESPLRRLGAFIDLLASPSTVLHVLPYHPACGDGGFAADDWFSVDSKYGSENDIVELASRRRIMVDGIYNHVGFNHWIVRGFMSDPERYAYLLHAYKGSCEVEVPFSPRGRPVLHVYNIRGEPWSLWQTFGESTFDIHLNEPIVLREIARHMSLVRSWGVWGLRLDACAYYGKTLGSPQFHHPEGVLAARTIAHMAMKRGLEVLAQLDSDRLGLQYFASFTSDRSISTVDYAYSALLVCALLTANIEPLIRHLQLTWDAGEKVLRAPRTHDGILLQSNQLSLQDRSLVVSAAHAFGLAVRDRNGSHYELNSSLPYLCKVGCSDKEMWQRLELAIAITAFIPGWCYLYLPALIGDIPESRSAPTEDPRSRNRLDIPVTVQEGFVESSKLTSARSLLELLESLRSAMGPDSGLGSICVIQPNSGVIIVRRPSAGLVFCGNFLSDFMFKASCMRENSYVGGRTSTSKWVGPLGFGIWRTKSVADL